MIHAQLHSYQNIGVTTASREMLILMAFEGAMKFLNQARMHIENGNIPGKCDRISRAMAVIGELSASLNMELGGEIAENLKALYDYMMMRLPEANLNSDPRILEEVLSLLQTLHDGWAEVVAQVSTAAQEARRAAPTPAPRTVSMSQY